MQQRPVRQRIETIDIILVFWAKNIWRERQLLGGGLVDQLNPGAGTDVFSWNGKTKTDVLVRKWRALPRPVCHPPPNDGVTCCIDGGNVEGFTGVAKHPTSQAATFESHCSSYSGFGQIAHRLWRRCEYS